MADSALSEALLQQADVEQRIRFDPNAALQKRIFGDGFAPNSLEFMIAHQDATYVAQRAERLSDGAVRVYYCLQGDWANVRFVARAQEPLDASPFDPATWRKTIWAITSIFESGRPEGRPEAFQNIDEGIISYGRHQATLQSSSLGEVLEEYFRSSNRPTKVALQQEYAARVHNRDTSLRHDSRFKALLLQAAMEQEMTEAQDVVFERRYYQPAVQTAQQYRLRTPLGLACVYDTTIQGGVWSILEATEAVLGGKVGDSDIDERRWLAVFLDQREAFLNRVASQHEAQGKFESAQMLRTSTFRVRELRSLLNTGNLGLEGELIVRQIRIQG